MGKPGPKKIHRYSVEFKLTAVKLSHMPGVEVQTVANALDIHPPTPSAIESPLGDFSLMLRTGARQIELSGAAIRGDVLPKLVTDGYRLLEELATRASLRGWTECYDQDLSAPNLVARSHWKWTPK